MSFPTHRPRRLRRTATIRALVRETTLTPDRFIAPLFVTTGTGVRRGIAAMPGCDQMSVDVTVDECRSLAEVGVSGVILFGIPDSKDPHGHGAADPNGPVPQALTAIRAACPTLSLWADVCLCEVHGPWSLRSCSPRRRPAKWSWTTTRRCPAWPSRTLLREGRRRRRRAVRHDGWTRRRHSRRARRRRARSMWPIVSYAAKYASAFYGPFREAAGSAPSFGDRRSYQMDPANAREALAEVETDIAEGADVIMVKPALAYLDVIRRVRDHVARAGGGLQRLGRVLDDQGGRRQRLARRAARDPRDPDQHPARGSRHHPHLLREGGRAASRLRSSARQRRAGPERTDRAERERCALRTGRGADAGRRQFASARVSRGRRTPAFHRARPGRARLGR